MFHLTFLIFFYLQGTITSQQRQEHLIGVLHNDEVTHVEQADHMEVEHMAQLEHVSQVEVEHVAQVEHPAQVSVEGVGGSLGGG
jgi:hypothetical protein